MNNKDMQVLAIVAFGIGTVLNVGKAIFLLANGFPRMAAVDTMIAVLCLAAALAFAKAARESRRLW